MLRWPAVGIPMKSTSNSMATSMIVFAMLRDLGVTLIAADSLSIGTGTGPPIGVQKGPL